MSALPDPASAEAAAPASARLRRTLVASAVIAALTVLVYSNTLDVPFHFDDTRQIVDDPGLRDLRGFWPPYASRYGSRYLGYLSFALNYRWGGLDVFGYHAANILIHLCNALLVSWLTAATLRTPALRRAEGDPLVRRYLPLVAGLLFAVHPVATQAVTYVVQRLASLATLFYLLSVTTYVEARSSLEADRPSWARAGAGYAVSLLSAAAAMKTKEMAFTLPVVLAGCELLFFRGKTRPWALVPHLVLAVLLLPVELLTRGRGPTDLLADATDFAAATREIPRSVYLLTQSRVVTTYLRLLVLPVQQNLDYDFPLSTSVAEPRTLLAIAFLAGLAALAVGLLVRASRTNRVPGVLVFFGIAWFFATASVESSLVPIQDVIFEHRIYLPSAGAVVAMGTALLWALERLHLRIAPGTQCAIALLLTAGPLAAATYARNLVWRDELTLWSDVATKSPSKPRPHYNLANTYQARGLLGDALREYQTTIRLAPGYAEAHNNLGNVYRKMGRMDDAIREHREAIHLSPGYADAHNNLGADFFAVGRPEDAIGELREVIRIDPRYATAHYNLGLAYRATGRPDEALRELLAAIELEPDDAEAHRNLGNLYEARGRMDEALREYRRASEVEAGGARGRAPPPGDGMSTSR